MCLSVKSHPEDLGDFGQGSTNISECNNQVELNRCGSSMVLTNPHMKLIIQFIIMKIFMKRVKICSKSPRFMGSRKGIKSFETQTPESEPVQ